MNVDEKPKLGRPEAMGILAGLARRLQSLTADVFTIALQEANFDQFDIPRLVGACFRTAQKYKWITRTDFSVKSKRNHSNLHSIWYSNLFGMQPDGKPIPKEIIDAEYNRWKNNGIEIPDKLAKFWVSQKELGNGLFQNAA